MLRRLHVYALQKETANGIRRRCTKHAQRCKGAVITTSGDDDFIITSEHNHGPSDIETNVTKTRLTMKQAALMSSEKKPASVVVQALQGLKEDGHQNRRQFEESHSETALRSISPDSQGRARPHCRHSVEHDWRA